MVIPIKIKDSHKSKDLTGAWHKAKSFVMTFLLNIIVFSKFEFNFTITESGMLSVSSTEFLLEFVSFYLTRTDAIVATCTQ